MEQEFLVVLLAGVTVFGLVFLLGQGGGSGDFLSQPSDRVTVFKQHVGKVGQSSPDFRNIQLGSFAVGEGRGAVRGFYKRKATVKDSLFGGKTLQFSYNATAPKEANVTFDVLGRKGRGSVYVKANGRKVFEEPMITSTSPTVTVPSRYLNPGYNTFEVGVKRPGVFTSSEYVLEDIELSVNDRRFHEHIDNFNLYGYEIEDFIEASLSFSITRSIKTAPLQIYVNGKQVYSKPQVRISPEEVKLTPSNSGLHPGNNVIEFRTDDGARYDIENAKVTIRYLANVDTQKVVRGFELNSSTLNHVNKEKTREKVVMDYQNLLPSPRPLEVRINDYSKSFTPRNGLNNVTVPEETLKDLNRMEIKSNGTYKLETVSIVSEKVE